MNGIMYYMYYRYHVYFYRGSYQSIFRLVFRVMICEFSVDYYLSFFILIFLCSCLVFIGLRFWLQLEVFFYLSNLHTKIRMKLKLKICKYITGGSWYYTNVMMFVNKSSVFYFFSHINVDFNHQSNWPLWHITMIFSNV